METRFALTLPRWVAGFVAARSKVFPTRRDRMEFVIDLARENVERGTGGPFGAGVFDAKGRLVAPGVNVVVACDCSICHAEMMAIALAQKKLGRYDISGGGRLHYELASSTEPCAMCFGAVSWSGVTRLVCGAREQDARSIGFDEGPKVRNWRGELEERGIRVTCDVGRQDAVAVLNLYAASGGTIYNARVPRSR